MKVRWLAYLEMADTPSTRTLLRIGGRGPSECRERIRRALRTGAIDQESCDTRLAMVDECQRLWLDFHYEQFYNSPADWELLPGGGYLRKAHLEVE